VSSAAGRQPASQPAPPRPLRLARRISIRENLRPVLGAAIFLLVMMTIFTIRAPRVFLNTGIFTAVFLSLPLFIILGLGLVFVTVAGESDLSFPSVVPLAGLTYTVAFVRWNFWVGLLLALAVGIVCGLFNGLLVTKLGLSSLITTLGMNFADVLGSRNRSCVRPDLPPSPVRDPCAYRRRQP
jgi:ribose/xylose/arabinose/galactoside ABC-type transport system permease subunit